jgi:N-acetylneuraminate synthase
MIKFKIGNRTIGENQEPLVIAEIGINHNGNLDSAISIVDSAIKAGAEIIKHQTHVVEDEMADAAKKVIPGNSNKSIYQIVNEMSLSEKMEKKLMNYVLSKKKIFFSSPFSRKAADRLERFGVPLYKIGSGECNNYPFVEYICKKKKPIILSTGMNNIRTIEPAVKIIRKHKIPYALLHCTNIYPTPHKLVRLNAMLELKKKFKDAVIGLSDHSETIYTALGAVAMGASIVEKHFITSKKTKGPDIPSSMDYYELKELIKGSKIIHESRNGKKTALKEEAKTIAFAFASIAAVKDIKKNEKLNYENIFPIRPSSGYYKVKDYKKLLGLKAKRNIKKGTQLKPTDVKKN